jgi:threonine/homoserine/homoserine lactone efflux protein
MFAEFGMTEIFARIFGLYFIAVGIAAVLDKEFYGRITAALEGNALVLFLTGFAAYAVGAVTVTLHNDWSTWLAIIVSLIGWIALIKGVLILALPKALGGFYAGMKFPANLVRVFAIFCVLLGAVMIWAAYWG